MTTLLQVNASLSPLGQSDQLADRFVAAWHASHPDAQVSVRDLSAQRPGAELFFITGADALRQILTWRGADQLFDLAHFVGVTRPGVPLSEDDLSHLPDDAVTLLEVPALSISSTACRDRVRVHKPIWYLVPDGIVQYIAKRGLYPAPGSGVSDDRS